MLCSPSTASLRASSTPRTMSCHWVRCRRCQSIAPAIGGSGCASSASEMLSSRVSILQIFQAIDQQQLAAADDGHDVGHPFHFADLMAGEQHGAAGRRDIDHPFQKLASHQRIEPGGGFVEDQQFRLVSQCQSERHFGPHPFGQTLDLSFERQLVAASPARDSAAESRCRRSRR